MVIRFDKKCSEDSGGRASSSEARHVERSRNIDGRSGSTTASSPGSWLPATGSTEVLHSIKQFAAGGRIYGAFISHACIDSRLRGNDTLVSDSEF